MRPSLEIRQAQAVNNGTNGTTSLETEGGLKSFPSDKDARNFELEGEKFHDRVLKVFRCLIADLCQQFGGGHPGGAMGMAAIGVALWRYVMRYSPSNPDYFNRDRFILSNEIEHEGIEVTTGPLGQGVANAVGFAMAEKHLAAQYNRPGYNVVDNMTWCMLGDACLQEGVALEAISLAGHWRLDNLCLIYDNNQITCDGSVDIANNEDVNEKMIACGFKVIDVHDGISNLSGIVQALETARSSDKPTFVNIRTIIGYGSAAAGNATTHGAALGVEDVGNVKKAFGLSPDAHFTVDEEVYGFFRDVKRKGKQFEKQWADTVESYSAAHPQLSQEFKTRVAGKMSQDWRKFIPSKESLPTKPTPSRKSAGLVCNPLAQNINTFMVGTADLSPSVNMIWKDKVDFQHPELRTACNINGNYTGRYIHWGIREHAMASISNGMAAYNRGTIIPVTSSFFMFYIYAAPGIRMGALQGLQQIHIATHDSIGTGEDGPTHQPIELAALYRAMPNLLYIRPCDSEEVAGAFVAALAATATPSMLSLSRQALSQFPQHSSRDGVQRGAYVFMEAPDAAVTLIGVGAEMTFAVQTRDVLARHGVAARIVSFPCQRLFDQQPREYRQAVLGVQRRCPTVVIEGYSPTGWERYADAAFCMGTFGKSLPGPDVYEYFGFNGENIASKVMTLLEEVKRDGVECLRGDFRDLNGSLGFGSKHI